MLPDALLMLPADALGLCLAWPALILRNAALMSAHIRQQQPLIQPILERFFTVPRVSQISLASHLVA